MEEIVVVFLFAALQHHRVADIAVQTRTLKIAGCKLLSTNFSVPHFFGKIVKNALFKPGFLKVIILKY
jgi:hypothetical protein